MSDDDSSDKLSTTLRKQLKYGPEWESDSDSNNCRLCEKPFTLFKRRHHCRKCGKLVCADCSPFKNRIEYIGENGVLKTGTKRVCKDCDDGYHD